MLMLPFKWEGTSSENANQYTNIIAMLIESYALDAVWSIAAMVSYAVAIGGDHIAVYFIFNNTGDQVTVSFFSCTHCHFYLKLLTPGNCFPSCYLSRVIGTGVDSGNRQTT
jgi:hypothetical protein